MHEVAVEQQECFADENGRVFHDSEHSEAEDRFVVIGMSATVRVLVVVHCYRKSDSIVRIISARKAPPRKRLNFKSI